MQLTLNKCATQTLRKPIKSSGDSTKNRWCLLRWRHPKLVLRPGACHIFFRNGGNLNGRLQWGKSLKFSQKYQSWERTLHLEPKKHCVSHQHRIDTFRKIVWGVEHSWKWIGREIRLKQGHFSHLCRELLDLLNTLAFQDVKFLTKIASYKKSIGANKYMGQRQWWIMNLSFIIKS